MQRYAEIVLILIVLLPGCAYINSTRDTKIESPVHIVGGVPFYPQEDYQCGPASLASVMNYWGVSITPEEIAKQIYSQSAGGTLNIDMVLYAQARGLESSHYKGGLDDLRKKIDSGQPIIVLVDYGFSIVQANHFMVVIGYNEHGVVVNSGRHEKKFISMDDFLKLWERTKFWTLLIKKVKSDR